MNEALGKSADGVRMTDEYTTAFDLEVWKAQQKARLRSQLRQEKEKLEREIHFAVREKEKKSIEELENTRKDLEKVAKRLHEAEKSTQRRTQQLELQEAAFEARRVKVAEQHEMHINRVELCAKRTVEDALFRQSLLEAQVLEKDTVIIQLREKLQSLEKDYDSIKEKMDSCLAEQSNAHAEYVRKSEQKFTQAAKAVDRLKRILSDRTQLLQRLWRENEELQSQLSESKLNLETLDKRYHSLLNIWYTREHEEKEKELKRLDEIQQCRRREGSQSRSENDPLYTMLHSLKADVTSYLNEAPPTHRERGTALNIPPPPPFVCAERPISASISGSTSRPPARVVEPLPSPPSVADGVGPVNSPAEEVDNEGSITGNTSTASYPRVEVNSWISDDEEEKEKDSEREKKEREEKERDNEKKTTPVYPSVLPPLAPAISTATEEVSPSPEDFAEATKAGASSMESARNEMLIFVHQLKINRQKLLDTGVYSEDHAVIKEMDEKISLYEQYLETYR